jgi:membrane-bound lytic murein transglycosylase D
VLERGLNIALGNAMRYVSVRCGLVMAFAILSCSAYPAILSEESDSFLPLVHDQHNEDTPAEIFPLMEMPSNQPEPLRSEAPSFQSERQWRDLRERILLDSGHRISPGFSVPEGLKERTAFWFDIYTRYGEAHHIIHHLRYPWIIFRVVDTTEMLIHGKGPTWLRRDRGNKLAKETAQEIRTALRKLARRKSYVNLSALERELYDKLLPLPGSRRSVFKMAAASVRSQLGQKDFFQRGLINSSRYLPYMEEEFKRYGLPTELTRMPFVESSFNEDAYSKVGASGIWQIMPRTGKAYMIVDSVIDERNSPLKATATAARLLRSYYRAMKSWELTITSYNHGIGNIQKAIARARSRDLTTIIARYHDGDFRFASSNFFTCFLAALYAEKYNELLFKTTSREPLQEREIVQLSGRTRARYLVKASGLDTNELLKYNLDLRHALKMNATLPRGYQLHLPPAAKDRLLRRIGTQERVASKNTRT